MIEAGNHLTDETVYRYANSTTSRLPKAWAARSSVCKVTDVLLGPSWQSMAAPLVLDLNRLRLIDYELSTILKIAGTAIVAQIVLRIPG